MRAEETSTCFHNQDLTDSESRQPLIIAAIALLMGCGIWRSLQPLFVRPSLLATGSGLFVFHSFSLFVCML